MPAMGSDRANVSLCTISREEVTCREIPDDRPREAARQVGSAGAQASTRLRCQSLRAGSRRVGGAVCRSAGFIRVVPLAARVRAGQACASQGTPPRRRRSRPTRRPCRGTRQPARGQRVARLRPSTTRRRRWRQPSGRGLVHRAARSSASTSASRRDRCGCWKSRMRQSSLVREQGGFPW